MSNNKKVEDNPKDALEAYLQHLWDGYYKWYENSTFRNYVLWLIAQVLALAASFGTALTAALVSDEAFKGLAAGRITLVVLPVLGWLAATVTVQSRVYERWTLREEGRRQFQFLVADGRRRFAAAKTPDEYSAIHQDLVKEADKIEEQQRVGFFELSPSFIVQSPGTKAQNGGAAGKTV